jgi:hypothetical protein
MVTFGIAVVGELKTLLGTSSGYIQQTTTMLYTVGFYDTCLTCIVGSDGISLYCTWFESSALTS